METTNNFQKTENKKFEKMTIKVFAAVISMVLISFAISAQGFCSPIPGNNTSTKMADHENESATLFASASPVLFAYSSGTTSASSTFRVETAKEKRLEIESWMIDSNYFCQSLCLADEKDEPLMVENWMIDEHNFSCSSVLLSEETDGKMPIESWMMNDYFWGK